MLPSLMIRRALRLFLLILGACFIVEWCCAWIARLRHLPFPYTTPLFDPAVRLSDWTILLPRARHFGELHFMSRADFGYPFQYPLPCIFPFVLFAKFVPHPTAAYVIFTVLAFFVPTLLLSLELGRKGYAGIFQAVLWATLLMGFPAAFLLDRGNVESFLWLGVLLGVVAYLRNRPYLAAVLLAIPACMKIYPALFLLLIVARRQYKAFALGVVAIAFFFFASVVSVGPDVRTALAEMAANGKVLRDGQILPVLAPQLRWDHSLFALEKRIVFEVESIRHGAAYAMQLSFEGSAKAYSLVVPLAFLALYLFRIRRMPIFNQFAAFGICAVLLPYISYEYTLVYLYLVWACFLLILAQDGSRGLLSLKPGALTRYVVLFALVMAPMSALTGERVGGQVRCLVLITLLATALTYPLPSRLFGDAAGSGAFKSAELSGADSTSR